MLPGSCLLVVIPVGLPVGLGLGLGLLGLPRLLFSDSVSSGLGKEVTSTTQHMMRVIQRAALMLEEPQGSDDGEQLKCCDLK